MTSKSAIFVTMTAPWPWPWPPMNLKNKTWRMTCRPVPIPYTDLWLYCVWLRTAVRTNGRTSLHYELSLLMSRNEQKFCNSEPLLFVHTASFDLFHDLRLLTRLSQRTVFTCSLNDHHHLLLSGGRKKTEVIRKLKATNGTGARLLFISLQNRYLYLTGKCIR